MTRLDALKALAEKVEAGLPNQNDGTLYTLFGDAWVHCWDIIDRGSLDAAQALHEAVLPGWTVNSLHQARRPDNGMPPTGQWTCLLFRYAPTIAHVETKAANPARAWLLAILRALIAQEKGK